MDQNALAKWVLEELEAERKWELIFAESEDVLDKLADEALAEHKKGKTKPNKRGRNPLCSFLSTPVPRPTLRPETQ